ncbi:epoxide hydrolase family protein [Chitinophaga arvensicola]|uniref:Pimeloyl-ACP methyl ester carboxylesterase n=1 Tax=Chitinophaga arvensicola TaxID=29529 RepID=A0A1I0RHH1_9BACT|nr:epoxide hydrolase family protein [Chitinophaga arvensicola]SEW39707.1 Pimeloyl-ACP methyl ester carboxylesterase [Chitinophaga arvensicola]
MKALQPFNIDVPQTVLEDLALRLKQTRWTDEPENAGWNYGTNPQYLRELVAYWQQGFDWRKQEALLNSIPQFTAEVDGVQLHFAYIKGKNANSQPLLLTHEWPDSFFRFYKIIPLLTTGETTFDLIIPSIPGFGFSQKVAVSSARAASLFSQLMTDVLGYEQYLAAGDFSITTSLAQQFPEQVKAIHLTDTGYPNGTEDWSTMSPAEQEFGQFIQGWWFMEGAFNMIQSTKPQTLGYALNDSPVGLASWILEKFYAWSDTKGNIENSFTKDEILTNIMIYWVTETINTAIRRYLEDARAMFGQGGPQPVPKTMVPTAVSVFPADSNTPEEWAARRVNLQRFSKLPVGGRFAALEQPELYSKEIRTFGQLFS